MQRNELVKLLDSLLSKAENEIIQIDLAKSDAENKSTLIVFIGPILSILDNTFNHYPGCGNDNYYPRPRLNESKADYAIRIRKFGQERKINITNSLRKFLLQVFDLNTQQNKALSLLPSSEKHKANKGARIVRDPSLSYLLTTTGKENPIQTNPDGSIDIGNSMHAEKGAHVSIKGSTIVSSDRVIYIDNLQYGTVNNGIVDFNGEKRNVTEWMRDCVTTCKELIKIIDDRQ